MLAGKLGHKGHPPRAGEADDTALRLLGFRENVKVTFYSHPPRTFFGRVTGRGRPPQRRTCCCCSRILLAFGTVQIIQSWWWLKLFWIFCYFFSINLWLSSATLKENQSSYRKHKGALFFYTSAQKLAGLIFWSHHTVTCNVKLSLQVPRPLAVYPISVMLRGPINDGCHFVYLWHWFSCFNLVS